MKAISLTQPWASAMVTLYQGRFLKEWETRGWATSYRGPIAIAAAKKFPLQDREFAQLERDLGRLPDRMPLGVVLGYGELVDCLRTEKAVELIGPIERIYGNYNPGRHAFHVINMTVLPEPIPAIGARGLWDWELPGGAAGG